jgi:hypothetical protein
MAVYLLKEQLYCHFAVQLKKYGIIEEGFKRKNMTAYNWTCKIILFSIQI